MGKGGRGERVTEAAWVQGPVDAALMGSLVAVTGSRKGWNDLSTNRMQQFVTEFPKWMRGDVPQVKDIDLSDAQIRASNLILFGDPASNKVTARVLPKLPVKWTKSNIEIGGEKYSSADHVLVMIYPNPLNPDRYVVLNSGHTFGEKEFKGTNALLYPRMGDWAVLNKAGQVVKAGLFDENWK